MQKILGSGSTSEALQEDVLLFVTIYNRLSWGQKILSRSSQHVVLASQSLGDLYEAIPCTSNELPEEVVDVSGNVTRYRQRQEDDMVVGSAGTVMCIEDVLYGDGETETDGAE